MRPSYLWNGVPWAILVGGLTASLASVPAKAQCGRTYGDRAFENHPPPPCPEPEPSLPPLRWGLELRLGAHALSTLYRDRVMAPDAMVRGGVGLILG